MKKLTKCLVILLAVAMLFALGACGGGEEGGGDEAEKLVMATNAAFPPYEYIENDQIVGIDAEIAKAVGEKLGKEVVIEDMEFGSIIAAVQSGKADFGLAGMTITEDRLKSVNFSTSYATGIQSIIVTADSKIKSIDDIGAQKALIGVQQDTTGDIYATDEFGEDVMNRFNKGADAVQALVTGKLQCVIIDNEPAKAFVEANEGLVIIDTPYAVEEYAMAIAKDNTEFLEEVNTAIAELQADGTIDAIIEKYIPTK